MGTLAIIGIDPGTTSAYAIIDLEGKLLSLTSGKELTLSEMIVRILPLCQPVLVATDKAKAPFFVEQFATKMGGQLVVPEFDLLKEEKRELLAQQARKEQEQSEDHHQADALAAALFAYKKYYPLLQKIKQFIKLNNLQALENDFTRLALKGGLHLTLIKEILTAPAENRVIKEVLTDGKITKNNFLKLYGQLDLVRQENNFLKRREHSLLNSLTLERRKVQKLDSKSYDFYKKLDSLLRFKEERIKVLGNRVKNLESELSRKDLRIKAQTFFMGRISQKQLVKKMTNLSQKEWKEKERLLSIKEGDVLWIEHPEIFSQEVANKLEKLGVIMLLPYKSAVITNSYLILSRQEFLEEHNCYCLLDKEKLISKLNSAFSVEKIVSEYRERRDGRIRS